MKSLTTIISEIASLEEEAAELKVKINGAVKYSSLEMNRMKKRFGAIGKKVVFLRQLKRFLETNPSREFLQKEEARLKNRHDLIDKELVAKFGDREITKEAKADFYKLMGVKTIKSHLKNIRFLLN